MSLPQTPSLLIQARTLFLLSVVRNVIPSVTFDDPNDVVYLYRLAEEAPLLYAKLALKESGLHDYVDAMTEFN